MPAPTSHPGSPPPIIEVRELEAAEQLIAELTPGSGSIWTPHDGSEPGAEWLFRGHANEVDGTIWKLTPKAFRPPGFLPFTIASIADPPRNAEEQRRTEINEVLRFASMVDRHGFVVPDDHHSLREPRVVRPGEPLDPYHFPPSRLLGMVALAQHNGVPTRLLDWTWKPLVAAYFAAVDVARRREPGKTVPKTEAPFSVLAIRRSVAEPFHRGRDADGADGKPGLDPGIYVITVPTATNSNLHAQGGVFTLVQPRRIDEHPLPNIEVVLERHAARIAELAQGTFLHLFPYLVEFRVPAREARTLLRLLAQMNVTAASVFPGLRGCVDAIKDERFHQRARVGERS